MAAATAAVATIKRPPKLECLKCLRWLQMGQTEESWASSPTHSRCLFQVPSPLLDHERLQQQFVSMLELLDDSDDERPSVCLSTANPSFSSHLKSILLPTKLTARHQHHHYHDQDSAKFGTECNLVTKRNSADRIFIPNCYGPSLRALQGLSHQDLGANRLEGKRPEKFKTYGRYSRLVNG